MICGMATLIDSRNSTTNSTSTTFRSKNLIPYLALRVSPMRLHPHYKHMASCGWGGWWSVGWQPQSNLETRLRIVRQQCSGQKIWYLALLWEFHQYRSTHITNIWLTVTEEGDDLWDGGPNWFLKLGYELLVHQRCSGQKNWYLTMFREFHQCICNHRTIVRRSSKEADHSRNGRPNWLSKLGYE